MQECKIDFQSIAWIPGIKGVQSKSYIQHDKQIRLVEFTQEFIEPDWCSKGHIGYVLEGALDINFFDGNILHLQEGDGLTIPVGKTHQHKAKILTKTTKLILVEEIEKE